MSEDPMRFAHSLIPNPDIPPDYNILASAISNCSGPVVHQLITQNPSLVNLKAWHGQIPLHRACLGGHAGIVGILLQAGADPNRGNDYDETPMHYAAKRGLLPVFKMLVDHGGDVTRVDKRGKTMVHHAAETGCGFMIHYLASEHGMSLSAADSNGQTPLHIVCKFGQTDAFKYLVTKGRSRPMQADSDGNTPMHYSAMEGHSYMTWLLLGVTGSKCVSIQNKDGYTPLDMAAQRDRHGNKELVPVLSYYLQNPGKPPRGPVLKWYWMLFMPGVTFSLIVLLAHVIAEGRYQGYIIFAGLGLILFSLRNQMHRLTDISRWPNPTHAGTFAAGLLHTAFYYFLFVMPSFTEYMTVMFLTPVYVFFLLYFYITLLKRDPGAVTQSEVDENTLKPQTISDLCVQGRKIEQFCIFCEIVRPIRTKHCRLCNMCFRDMDHHCLFLLTCIAVKNHARFIRFIGLTLIAMVIFLGLSIVQLYDRHSQLTLYDFCNTMFVSNSWHLCLLGLNTVSIVWGVSLLLFQFRMVANGYTTVYQPRKNVDVLSTMEKFMNVIYFIIGKKPFARNPFLENDIII